MAKGTVYTLPNYFGQLFTADEINTPFLKAIGGLTGGLTTGNKEFVTGSLYSLPAAKQPDISEDASFTAPTASIVARTQETNVVQIFQEAVDIGYVKQANQGRLSGVNTAGKENNAKAELAWQIQQKLKIMARDAEYTFLNGVFNKAVSSATKDKTRGMLELTEAHTVVDASGVELNLDIMDQILKDMYTAGADFKNVVIWGPAGQIVRLSKIYGFIPTSRTVGGVAINEIVTTYGTISVARPHKMMPATKLLIAEMSVIAPVSQPVPNKGNFFYEELAKTGASDKGQLFGLLGLDHGPAFLHGSIKGLKG